MTNVVLCAMVLLSLWFPVIVSEARGEAKTSAATEECLGCHSSLHPGIVTSWKQSSHASVSPADSLAKEGFARRVTNPDVPEELKGVAVGCAECHSLNSASRPEDFEHNGYTIHTVVTPKDCAACHAEETAQYGKNLMAHAYGNLAGNSAFGLLVHSVNGLPVAEKGKITQKPSDAVTDAESCYYCHGTKLTVTGTKTRDTDQGPMEFPVLSGWPNQGVGRVNPDASLGSCAACHTRHDFSVAAARKPYTCKECHAGPDVPANKVFDASKHGTIYGSDFHGWNFKAVPWKVGVDFTAPTCAACHMSLLVDPDGKVVSRRTHEMKDRLPWRIFGLIYAHPQPKDPNTTIIRNKDGLPLPTDFGGGFAEAFLMSDQERQQATKAMQAACLACHASSWVEGHWERFTKTIELTNAATLAATGLMGEIWERGLATGLARGGNPFDEYLEKVWSDIWLFYANTTRFASAMAGGGDYGAFADGRYQAMRATRELEAWLAYRGMPTTPATGAPAPAKARTGVKEKNRKP